VCLRHFHHFRFQQDNTLADAPVAELLVALQGLLEGARARGGGARGCNLQQLVLVLADGHFHEKESLRRKVRAMADTPGQCLVVNVLRVPVR
jgi:midasin